MKPVLEVKGVGHTYGSTVALDDVNLAVAAGEFVALLGPNGAGKTTLVRSVIGLLSPRRGSLTVAGGSPLHAEVRRRLGVVQQDVGFPRTLRVHEVVDGAAARAGVGREAAERVLAEMGLEPLRTRKASDLSGGQQQRLQLAMGLVADPLLLVLDEPTAGLDVAARRAFWESLDRRRQTGAGILLTTHVVEEAAAVADRVVILDRGRVVAAGTPDELKRQLPGRRITARTTVPPETIRSMDGVVSATGSGDQVVISAVEAEPVVRLLLELDKELSDLVVATASLDEVLYEITGPRKEMAA